MAEGHSCGSPEMFMDGLEFPPNLPSRYTLPETNMSHLKMDDWKTILSFWGSAHVQVLCKV